MTSAFNNVIINPRSASARRALMEEWKAANNPQWKLIDLQLRDSAKGRMSVEALNLEDEHKREWSNGVHGMVYSYYFCRGLVGYINVQGSELVKHADYLFSHAPIQHVTIWPPYDLESVLALPWFRQLVSLSVKDTDEVTDDFAFKIASSPSATTLRSLSYWKCQLSAVGIRALQESRYLQDMAWILLDGNPGALGYETPSGVVSKLSAIHVETDRLSLVGPEWVPVAMTAGEREVAEEFDTQSPTRIFLWPPRDELLASGD